jgi:hypothetical protein
MGASQSTTQPITHSITMPVLHEISNDYNDYTKYNGKSDKKKIPNIVVAPYRLTNANRPKSKKNSPLLEIEKNPQITINNELLVAKFSIFQPQECIDFAFNLKSMIMSTAVGKVIIADSRPVGLCRFLKIYVAPDSRYYLMPLAPYRSEDGSQWIEDSFTKDGILLQQFGILLPQLLSMIKRQKQLINVNGGFIFYVEFFLNRGIVTSDIFHVDVDIFRREFTPTYISVTNISQNGYGLSTEIKSSKETDNKSYTFLTKKCETVILHNNFLKHRTPALHEINESKYNQQHSVIQHQSDLTDFNTPVMRDLNSNIRGKGDPRDLIRMLITPVDIDKVDLTNLQDITHLVPESIFKSPIVNYKFVVFDRSISNNDIMSVLTSLKPHSIGGKSKKKRYKNPKQKSKKYRKSYKQLGGNITDFAFYAENPETSNLIENNVEINLDI